MISLTEVSGQFGARTINKELGMQHLDLLFVYPQVYVGMNLRNQLFNLSKLCEGRVMSAIEVVHKRKTINARDERYLNSVKFLLYQNYNGVSITIEDERHRAAYQMEIIRIRSQTGCRRNWIKSKRSRFNSSVVFKILGRAKRSGMQILLFR